MSKPLALTAAVAFLCGGVTLGANSKPGPPAPKLRAPSRLPSAVPSQSPKSNIQSGDAFFTREVRPVLEQNCTSCHSGDKPPAGLKLTSRAAMLRGGASGPAISLTMPAESLLIKAINYQGRRMPPRGQLSRGQIEVLTRWVSQGAPWPESAAAEPEARPRHTPPPVTAETMRFWSFQRVKRPAVPRVKQTAWVRNPVDAFVLHKLEAAGLAPNPPAGKAALIRRAYYDLLGLPPSPEEVQRFVADPSPQAWPKLVDRLLASPQYGERWGRHWLDLVRYAESNSYERDGTKPNAWRYRDYVIQSLNADKPYNQFVTEQLAGDELAPRTPERLIATGYYRLGIWDDEPVDPEQALYDDLDDVVSTTGQVFLGLTLGCARCHDHKLDPIPQKDYYRFLAFFSGVQRYGVHGAETVAQASLRPLIATPEQERQREVVEAYQARVKANQEQIGALERRILADLTPVEKEEWRNEGARNDIVKKRVPALLSVAEFDDYVTWAAERLALRQNPPPALEMALCVTEVGAKPRETFVLARGNAHAAGEKVEPGFPSVLAPPPPTIAPSPHGDTSGRRLALAHWLASAENPLTARVLVNRLWQYHLGRGIVRSSNDFGFQGEKPTHPELLDWLAAEFMATTDHRPPTTDVSGPADRPSSVVSGRSSVVGRRPPDPYACGWRLKPLHRLIMLSAAYQMSSRANPRALARDPHNDLLWRVDMRRLEAEEVRDSLLAVNGSLNRKMGGPSIYPSLPAEVLAGQSRPGADWGQSTAEEQCRRSVYIFVKRSLAVPILASFDGPEPDFTCPARFATTQPTQALGLLNSAFLNEQASVFAAFLRQHAGEEPAAQVRLALWRVAQRPPTVAEIGRGVRLIETLRREEGKSAEDALALFCVVALNLNEFVYLD